MLTGPSVYEPNWTELTQKAFDSISANEKLSFLTQDALDGASVLLDTGMVHMPDHTTLIQCEVITIVGVIVLAGYLDLSSLIGECAEEKKTEGETRQHVEETERTFLIAVHGYMSNYPGAGFSHKDCWNILNDLASQIRGATVQATFEKEFLQSKSVA